MTSELDSVDTHTASFDLVADRRRQNAILLAGWRVCLRFTWWDLENEPRRVVAEVATALSM